MPGSMPLPVVTAPHIPSQHSAGSHGEGEVGFLRPRLVSSVSFPSLLSVLFVPSNLRLELREHSLGICQFKSAVSVLPAL